VTTFGSLQADAELSLASAGGHGSLFGGVLARDVMTTRLSCLRTDETVGDAAEFFINHQLNSAPVVDEHGKLCGILSEKDLLGVMLWPESWRQPVSRVMKGNVVFYEEDTPAVAVYDFLSRVTIRRVVIVKDGVPTGVVSRANLLQWFTNWSRGGLGFRGTSAESPAAQNSRAAFQQLAASLSEQVEQLESGLVDQPQFLSQLIVSKATRIQDLTTDLLAHLRRARESGELLDAESETHEGTACGAASLPWFPPGCLPDVLMEQ
jgi:CBS domain-containing protein